ncbi:MAG: hypothetical protein WAU97_05975, partial [Gemmiger qucibialis]
MQAQNPAVTAETDCTFDFSYTPQGKNYPIFIIQAEVYHKKCPRATGAFLLYAVQFCADKQITNSTLIRTAGRRWGPS